MIKGIGTDILKIQRIRNMYGDGNDPFIHKTFSVKERDESEGFYDPALFFAILFGCKEAVFKGLGIDDEEIRLNEIEILGIKKGQAITVLSGTVKEKAVKKQVKEVLVSYSCDDDYVVTFAVAL